MAASLSPLAMSQTELVECAVPAPRQRVGRPLLESLLRSLREADEKLAGGVLNAFQLPGLQWQGKEKLADAQCSNQRTSCPACTMHTDHPEGSLPACRRGT
ncbi:hypothetical protein FHY29_001981 [Xanthomonas arboricola]|uniref:hypothetical protein n=1 Tax=Xanthomonas arboricola TaxID=56448 RepID=UPI000CED8198|nr:hypothetical protein [Xanthomonas arboricola]PPU53403.1 hypothetical protein XarbCFBP6827_18920 [Xanthomonas arboricola]